MSRCLLFAVGALEAVVGVGGGEDPRGMTESFGSPLGCRRAVYPPRRLQPTSLFLPGRRRWLKITPWPRALQRAAWAAKGKDNVLAALIRVCGCHILITSLKKNRKRQKEEKKERAKQRKRLHHTFVQGMHSKFLWGWASWSSPLGKLFTVRVFVERGWTRRGGWVRDQLGRLRGANVHTASKCLHREPCDLPRAASGSRDALALSGACTWSPFSVGPKSELLLPLRHVHFPGAQTRLSKMPSAKSPGPFQTPRLVPPDLPPSRSGAGRTYR